MDNNSQEPGKCRPMEVIVKMLGRIAVHRVPGWQPDDEKWKITHRDHYCEKLRCVKKWYSRSIWVCEECGSVMVADDINKNE